MYEKLIDPERLALARRANRVWFWKPQWYWHGWSTLSPILIGHDDLARRTLTLGWTITGRAIIALWDCGDPTCREEWAIELYVAYHLGELADQYDGKDAK